MKRYRMVLASGGDAEVFDLVCRNDKEALVACHDQMQDRTSAEAWDGNQLICRWERTAA